MLLWCILALYFSVRLNADHDEKRIGCVPALLSCLRDTLFQGAGHGEFYSVASCEFYKHLRNRTLAFCALRFPLPASFPYRKKRSHRLWSDSLKSKFVGGRCQKQPCDRISSVGLNHESFAKCPQRPMRTSIQDLAMYLELQSLVVRMEEPSCITSEALFHIFSQNTAPLNELEWWADLHNGHLSRFVYA